MGARGRGSAKNGLMVLFVTLIFVLYSVHLAEAGAHKDYQVGDGYGGWTKGVNWAAWLKGKTFKQGDVLVFRYDRQFHNVVASSKSNLGFTRCNARRGHTTTYNTGNDRIRLKKGTNYFFCGFPGHCLNGMKMAVFAY